MTRLRRLRARHWVVLTMVAVTLGTGGAVTIAHSATDPNADVPFLPVDSSLDIGLSAPGLGVIDGPVDGDVPVDPDGEKSLYGYTGPLFNPLAQSGGIKVLQDTLNRQPGATWKMMGLARNETAETVGRIRVTASLRDANGNTLAAVSTMSPVPGVRKGEPVPFSLTSDIPVVQVAQVEYGAQAIDGPAVTRELSTQRSRQEPYGDRDAVTDVFAGVDTQQSPHPFITLGNVMNLGANAMRPLLVGAWRDDRGRIFEIATIPRTTWGDAGPTEPDTSAIEPGAGGTYLYHNSDPEQGPKLDGSTLLLWSWGDPS